MIKALEGGQENRGAVAKAAGPTDWSSVTPKHCEVLDIPWDPPEFEPDITEIEKIRQCVFVAFSNGIRKQKKNRANGSKKNLRPRKNLLALPMRCDRLAPIWSQRVRQGKVVSLPGSMPEEKF